MSNAIDFEAVFRRSPNPYMVLDRELRFVDANEAYLYVTGTTLESILGRGLFEAFPGGASDDDPPHVRQLRRSLKIVLAEKRPDTIAVIHYPIEYETGDGRMYQDRYWSATHTPLLDEDGEVAFVLQHTVDVTDLQETRRALRKAEAELDEVDPMYQEEGVFRRAQVVQQQNITLVAEHRRFKRLIGHAPGFIAILDGPEHIFSFANEAYYEVVGKRNILGMSVRDALPEVVGQGFHDLLDRVYATGEPFIGRGMLVKLQTGKDHELRDAYVDFIYQPIVEDEGNVSGIFVQGHDVTDQYRAQKALEDLNENLERRVAERTAEVETRNRELQEFAFVASHDLQEPLRKVHSFADLLIEEYSDEIDENGRHYFDRMQGAVRRMSLLIKDLLLYSRISTGVRTYEEVQLESVVRDVLYDLQIQLEEASGAVHVGELPSVMGDPVQLRQLFQNLISNAVKFRKRDVPPEITISGYTRDKGAVHEIMVADNGIGVSDEFAERIFQPFQRLHRKEEYSGTGIGLAICRRIAERHGGTITVESNDDGGATFVITLPVHWHPQEY
jgi:PAS domain S-box-containing protein